MHAQVLLGTPQVVGGTEVRYFVLVCAPAVRPYSRTMEGVVRKVAPIAPVSGFGLLRESLRKVLNQGSSTR
ncbi:hypothetical protein DAD99_12875 [Pseudarthrobacter sp. AB1]|nr:hypothetical protein [Pseudarthrobacter sp. AB1]